eukprot:CAMPEP_0197029234 /NCGR_PEP_ID=MMETSP1384-20130603/8734_1 /TAXON_ID=29189 /ORGANISM="Ammonia sp." /LENGTH=378 /DNA_ID=CAMNT_0042458361 /DNA_START=137 /DNA_END=1273 /DNA_ORIENTATION=+
MLRHLLLICFSVSTLAPTSVTALDFFVEWWTWFTYHFMWSNKFTYFNPYVCQLSQQTSHTFYFGGSRSKGKLSWVVGSNIWNYKAQKLGDWANIVEMVDARGQVHTKNAGSIRLPREKLMPLMIGSDYFEPCTWTDEVPKILSFKVVPSTTAKFARGEFDMFVGKGKEECGQGRLSRLGEFPKDGKEQDAWIKKATTFDFRWDPNPDRKQPMATFNSGGIFSGDPGRDDIAQGRYFTSALFDGSMTEQTVCLIFWCHNSEAACAVNIEHWQVSDIAGRAYAAQEGTAFWNMTPMDLFALAMTIFSPLFFCIQCCCCCQICAHELRGGVPDQQAILEEQVRNSGNTRSPQRARAPRTSPRHARYQRRAPRSPRRPGTTR